jgi:hypothetical protein
MLMMSSELFLGLAIEARAFLSIAEGLLGLFSLSQDARLFDETA